MGRAPGLSEARTARCCCVATHLRAQSAYTLTLFCESWHDEAELQFREPAALAAVYQNTHRKVPTSRALRIASNFLEEWRLRLRSGGIDNSGATSDSVAVLLAESVVSRRRSANSPLVEVTSRLVLGGASLLVRMSGSATGFDPTLTPPRTQRLATGDKS